MYTLYWNSADGQASMDCGEYATEVEARAAIADALDDLLDQCADEEEADSIRAGDFSVAFKNY